MMFVQEKAFKDSINLCLGLERKWLFVQRVLRQDIDSDSALQLLSGILMLMEALERSDAKVKLLKELTSANARISKLEENECTDIATSSTLRVRCEEISKKLAMGPRILSRHLIVDPFLSKFFYKQSDIYDTPYCDIWRGQSPEEIKLQAQYWLHHLEPAWQAIELILWLVRSTGSFQDLTVQAGFHRESNIEDILNISLVRVQLDRADIYPTISIAHRWLVVTLYQGCWSEGAYQLTQLETTQDLKLALCC